MSLPQGPAAILTQLRAARSERGLSQRALARLLDMSQSHLSKIENAATDIQISTLFELASAVGLDVKLVPRQVAAVVDSLARQAGTEADDSVLQRRATDVLSKVTARQPPYRSLDDDEIRLATAVLQRIVEEGVRPDRRTEAKQALAALNLLGTGTTHEARTARLALGTLRHLLDGSVPDARARNARPARRAYRIDDEEDEDA